MKFNGYVADIDNDVDSAAIDFETTDYYTADAALVSKERIRLEWTEGDMFCAVTIDNIVDKDGGELGSGKVEWIYRSFEGGRYVQRRELGKVTAIIIPYDDEADLDYFLLSRFRLDVKWTTNQESGRFLFELESEDADS